MTKELKRCPFCGGRAVTYKTVPYRNMKTNRYESYYVMCEGCLTSSNNYVSEEECALHWNRRMSDA